MAMADAVRRIANWLDGISIGNEFCRDIIALWQYA